MVGPFGFMTCSWIDILAGYYFQMLKIEFWWCLAKPFINGAVDEDKFRDVQLNNEKSEKP